MSADRSVDNEDAASEELAARRFNALLERLRADGAAGGFSYEQLRRRLILFFRQREPVDAETLADEALDRLARRLDEQVAIDNPALYAFGIAKLMLFEAHARRLRHDAIRSDVPAPAAMDPSENDETDPALLAALRACLKTIGPRGCDLIFTYYRDDDARRIKTRRELAAQLGITLNTLRNRALRLRTALETCVRERLRGRTRDADDGFAQTDTSDDD
ncbi:MAG TPA: hypothetical protein VF132_08215 [Rudaea sp.]